jgi:hypothetical protein
MVQRHVYDTSTRRVLLPSLVHQTSWITVSILLPEGKSTAVYPDHDGRSRGRGFVCTIPHPGGRREYRLGHDNVEKEAILSLERLRLRNQ